jgi:intein/homing endonuclease
MKISGYTTSKNVVLMDYPFIESITSMLSFCDEVCVLDSSDQDDGTWGKLLELQKLSNGKLKIHHENIDWQAPNHGIFDGKTKQMAREMCKKGQYLVQFDVDEIMHEDSIPLIKPLIEQINPQLQKTPILTLPVVEFWGKTGKVRMDINVWKWRISLNIKDISHGIPISLRQTDPITGLEYAKHGSDSCVPPYTKIMTIQGEKRIDELKMGELVLTHKGNFRAISQIFIKPKTEYEIYKIKPRDYLNSLEITGNHPIYFSDKKNKIKWHQLDKGLPNKDDYFVFPKLSNENFTQEPIYNISIKKTKMSSREKITIKPSRELGFIVGLFLGDGNITKRTENKSKFKNISFSLSGYQKSVVNQLESYVKNIFGINHVSKYFDRKKNYWSVKIHNKDIAKFVFKLCRTGSLNKLLSNSFYNWNTDAILGILEGLYQSDGADCRSGINITMTNGKLLSQIKVLLTKINIFSSLKSYMQKPNKFRKTENEMFQLRITGKQVSKLDFIVDKKKKRFQKFLELPDKFAIKANKKSLSIEKIKYNGTLYNIAVEGDNSYVANGITVHNCNYISKATGEPYECIYFVQPELEQIRINSIYANPFDDNLKTFELWFNNAVQQLPTIYHYSWFNIERKIRHYKLFWTNFWKAMYNENRDERTNPFFPGLLWSEVTDDMIKEKALLLEEATGGHIFHSPFTGKKSNHVRILKNHPKIMDDWIKRNL